VAAGSGPGGDLGEMRVGSHPDALTQESLLAERSAQPPGNSPRGNSPPNSGRTASNL